MSSNEVPKDSDRTQEGYYSVFQIDHLSIVISAMTLNVHMDSYLSPDEKADSNQGRNWERHLNLFGQHLGQLRADEFRRGIGMLCQFISERYFPHARGDQRTIQVPTNIYQDQWISAYKGDRDWHMFARDWSPKPAESLFQLTPNNLRHAYQTLAFTQANCDPLENWHQLVQFVSIDQRDKLKTNALLAETLRQGANMLRLLHKHLYDEELPSPNEVIGTIITHIPELEIRRDTRRYLEFVVNRFGLNPQPRLTIFVEGQSEEHAITRIFQECFGFHPGTLGIEIVVLQGVDVATGSKQDRFRAIIRIIDYLHHHQTISFLILDNENYAKKLKTSAREAKSIHHNKRFATKSEYIRIWKNSFEFDNFSCSEIATAMNDLAEGNARFSRQEILDCKNEIKSGACLSMLYKNKTNYGLKKIKLNDILVNRMLTSKRRPVAKRPIVVILRRISELAALNHFPTQNEIWERNQISEYLGKKRR